MATRPLERLFSALPDATTAGYFLTLWLAPLAFGGHSVRNGMLIMLVEFIVVHCSGFHGAVAFCDTVSRSAKIKTLLGFAVFYLLFIAAWSYAFKAWWPFVAFGWLWVGKAVIALDKHLPTQDRIVQMKSSWALSVIFFGWRVHDPVPADSQAWILRHGYGAPGSPGPWGLGRQAVYRDRIRSRVFQPAGDQQMA